MCARAEESPRHVRTLAEPESQPRASLARAGFVRPTALNLARDSPLAPLRSTMGSSIVHLSLAVVSGVALGAAGALSLRKETRAPPPSAQRPSGSHGAPPVSGGGQGVGAGPSQVVGGGLPARDVRDRVVNGGSIGASTCALLTVPSFVELTRDSDSTPLRRPHRIRGCHLSTTASSSNTDAGPISDLLVRQAYTAAYDRRNKIPAWTAEHLTAASLQSGGGDRQMARFVEDDAVPEMFRARLLDYFKSGYDRGHMVPAADAKQSQAAMAETFLLSNIAPQVGEGFNRHYWAYLEAVRLALTSRECVSNAETDCAPLVPPAVLPQPDQVV